MIEKYCTNKWVDVRTMSKIVEILLEIAIHITSTLRTEVQKWDAKENLQKTSEAIEQWANYQVVKLFFTSCFVEYFVQFMIRKQVHITKD